ncbi:telomere stability and silencing-domain-containing protein [Glomus cerebriforme]|uniref:Telomere stability and silencing-domain-containing protein n=1 Tax=Glomus cerebriforme TaxID=658196 RepID=A0A397TKB0_9GLOM|nr:telomere stability and silencing-domain-containing protein [Glomus cerebriforme]
MAATLHSFQSVNNFSYSPPGDRLSNKNVFKEKPEQQYRSVIVTLFSNKKTMCLVFPTDARITVFDVKQIVYKRLLLEPKYQYLHTTSGKLLNDYASIFENDNEEFVNVNLRIRILGGKGGFGSMLRAQGGKMASQKTTNFEACRDLNGRRLRTVNEARRLADHLEQEPERQRAQREKVKKKIEEGLREPPTKKHRFDDTAYLKASEEMKEKVQSTVAEALQKPGNKKDASIGSSKNVIASLSMDVEISDYDSGGSEDNDTEVEDSLEAAASKKKEKGKDKDTKKRKLSEI